MKGKFEVMGLVLILLCLCIGTTNSYAGEEFDPGLADITIKVNDILIPYFVFAFYVLPGETIPIEIYKSPEPALYSISGAGSLSPVETSRRWQWTAPTETGVYTLGVFDENGFKKMTLHGFVMVPFSRLEGETLNGFRIGQYPEAAFRQLGIYEKPEGFIEVTPQNETTLISPHFRIGQFLSKQAGDYPKYLVLQERLLLKLELILEKVNEKGYLASTFVIMSGYRTPYYNKLIGNVGFSRHLWGCAADIFIDRFPEDGIMDDLNEDGVIDILDAEVLADIINDLSRELPFESLRGGLGKYRRTAYHGPFVHVDVRGVKARWGP